MGIVTLPRRFQTITGQPAQGADGCFVAHVGNYWKSQGAVTIGTPPCWRAAGTANEMVTAPDSQIPYLITNQVFSVICFAKPNTTTSPLCGGGISTAAGGWNISASAFSYRRTGATQTIAFTSTAGTPYVYAVVGTPSQVEAFQNGVSVGTAAFPIQVATSATTVNAWILGDNSGAFRGNADVYLVAYFNRALTAAEVMWYSTNPAALLLGKSRITSVSTSTGRTGSMSAIEGTVDSFSGTGQVIIKGSLSVTESTSDTTTITGKVIVKGSMSATEGTVDIFAGSGTTTGGRTGTANMTEGTSDTSSITGTILVQGSLNATENTVDIFTATNVVPTTDKCVNSKWIVNMGSSSGAIQLQMASDVNGVDVTLKEGLFFLKYRKI